MNLSGEGWFEERPVPPGVRERVDRILFERLGWTTALPDHEFWAHFRAVLKARQTSALVPEVLARLRVVG